MDDLTATHWDVVIVGGGSAGCVLANRLSADPQRKVLLVEAGRDIPPGTESSAILDMYPGRAAFDPANHWPDLPAHFQPVSHNAPERPPLRHYEQARVMGGGSSINGQVANRGTPADYDEWASLGASGWDWQSVLPFFKRLERDLDFDGPLHGSDGPIPIHRIPRAAWPRFSTAATAALTAQGFHDIADQNGCYEDGWFAQTLSNDGRHRVSAAMGYLDAATRRRENLAILAKAQMIGLVGAERRITGIEVEQGGARKTLQVRAVILSAGAIHSPAILLRAGIGPAGDLHAQGIPVRHDLAGVGRNLQEHPGISVAAFLKPEARLGATTRRHIHAALRFSSGHPGCAASDMYMMVAAKSAWHPIGRRVGTLIAWINKIHSRGQVSLRSPDPHHSPLASFNYLADPRDAARLKDAMRFMATLVASPDLAALVEHASPASYSGFARALGRQTLRNLLITAPTALALDLSPAIRRHVFRHWIAGGTSLAELLADDDALEAYVRARAFGQWHPAGTCRMGEASDRNAVVDPADAHVRGIEGLHVVDASVMPTVPRANLNIPTIMLAEKFADGIAHQTTSGSGFRIRNPEPVLIPVSRIDESFARWPELLALIRAAFAFMDGRIDPPSSAHRLTVAQMIADAAAGAVFIAQRDGAIIGCVFCKPRGDALTLGKLAITPALQRSGLGRALIAAAETEARRRGLAALELQTRIELVENHAAFAKLGFVKSAETTHPGFTRPTSITMRRVVV